MFWEEVKEKKREGRWGCSSYLLDFFDSVVGFSRYTQLLWLHIYYDQNWVRHISEIIPRKYISRAYHILKTTKRDYLCILVEAPLTIVLIDFVFYMELKHSSGGLNTYNKVHAKVTENEFDWYCKGTLFAWSSVIKWLWVSYWVKREWTLKSFSRSFGPVLYHPTTCSLANKGSK